MAASVYTRQKNPASQWRYARIEEKRGIRTSSLSGPFYTRYSALTEAGKKGQQWHLLAAGTYAAAKTEAEQLELALEAKAKGLTVAELDSATNVNRIPIRSAIDTYLEQKSGKAKKTVLQYRLALNEFLESFHGTLRFLDQIDAAALRAYKKSMEKQGYAGKTIDTRLNIVYFLLKKNGVTVRLPNDEMPTIEREVAVPYTDEELQKLFAATTPEENLRYKFFLGTGCRDKEVSFASWQDIDFTKALYHVRKKEDVGFTLKGHESRTVPIPKGLLAMLRARRENPRHTRWIFVNDESNPENHFLRKLKRIAWRARLNCGQCETSVTVGKYDSKKEVRVSCKDKPVCEHFYLHRFRKTCATRWQENGIPINTIRVWLGHKNLQTTQIYLGVTDSGTLRSQIDKAFGD